jgi:hypothetical protein
MSEQNRTGWGAAGVGQQIDEAIGRIEAELRGAIGYVNDAVVPQVRRESISAMRSAADTLRNLADRFERQGNACGEAATKQPEEPRQ